ncbi:MAG TPA: GGDEF domain-containing protein [Aquabacterium sp.]|nr:GGDEF domain-containing protein [Aquabacterium sp.]
MTPTGPHRLRRLLLGEDPRMRDRTTMCLLATLVYLAWFTLLTTFALPRGRVSPALGGLFVAHMVPAMVLFYPLVRSGLTRHLSDPGLVAIQMLWAGPMAVTAYALVPTGRAAMLQLLGLILVFGFISLSPRQALGVGLAFIGMLLTVLVVGYVVPLPSFDPHGQTIKLLTAGCILGLITLQSRKFAQMRERVLLERRDLAAAQEELERVTRHDSLTGLFSRPHGQERLDQEQQRAQLSGRPFGVILLDLDHFKQINDRHGHHVGDEVLVQFAQAARQAWRDTDLIARWGGEEFLVILPDTSSGDAAQQALLRLRRALQARQPSRAVPDLRVTFSAGYALWQPGEAVDHLLQRADQALYAAKHAGRNRTVEAVPA